MMKVSLLRVTLGVMMVGGLDAGVLAFSQRVHNACPNPIDEGDGLYQPRLPGFERSEQFASSELNVGTYNQLRT